MSITEKAAYLKGLSDGLALDPETKEGKLITAIIDTIFEMAEEIAEISENALDIGEELDAISSDLADVEEFLFDDEFDIDDDYDGFDFDDDYDDYDDYDDQCGCAFCGGGADFSYNIECPACGAEIKLGEDDLIHESVKCESCGEVLEFEFDYTDAGFDEDDDEDDDEA